MGQKTHPLASRIPLNRSFDSQWAFDIYSQGLKTDFLLRKILHAFFTLLTKKKLDFLKREKKNRNFSLEMNPFSLGRIFYQQSPQSTLLTLFFFQEPSRSAKRLSSNWQKRPALVPPKKLAKRKSLFPPLSTALSVSKINPLKTPLSPNSPSQIASFFKKHPKKSEDLRSLVDFYGQRKSLLFNNFGKLTLKQEKRSDAVFFPSLKSLEHKLVQSLGTKQKTLMYGNQKAQFKDFWIFDIPLPSKPHQEFLSLTQPRPTFLPVVFGASKALKPTGTFWQTQKIHPLLKVLEKALTKITHSEVYLLPVKVQNWSQSAAFLADKIVQAIEKNQKKSPSSLIAQLLKRKSGPFLGVRILCSGRLRGVEMANKFVLKKGPTSLNIFSQKIDFAYRRALTKYGIIGVKVWLSYN